MLMVAVLIYDKILDQNCKRLQFYGHVSKTANAGSSLDSFGPIQQEKMSKNQGW